LSQAWLGQRERANAASLRLGVRMALFLGRPAGRALLVPVCLYFLVFSVKARAASRQYLHKALGRTPGIADLFRHYYCFATVALDRMFLLHSRFTHFDIRVHGAEVLAESRDRGECCFLLGAHLGSFEALHAYGEVNRIPVTMMMFEHGNRNMNTLAKAIDPHLERTVIGMGSVDSMMKLRDRLEAGEWVGMLGDRGLFEGSHQVTVPFFGEPAAFSTAPFRIAAMFGRPVVLMFALYRGGNCYDLHFERLIDFPGTDAGKSNAGKADAPGIDARNADSPGTDRAGRNAMIREWVALYARRIEHHCREAPYNWFNFYDFWGHDRASR